MLPLPSKRELTKLFLTQINIALDPAVVSQYFYSIWATPHSPIGYRLTYKGHAFLTNDIKLHSSHLKITSGSVDNLKLFLQLNKHLVCPYYLSNNNSIYVYGEEQAVLLMLMGGDLIAYFKSQE